VRVTSRWIARRSRSRIRAEGHISLDGVGTELADFLDSGRQLFAVVVPIEHHVSILQASDREVVAIADWRYDDGNKSSCDDPLLPELCRHPGNHMVEVVAVKRPSPRIVGIECDSNTAHRHDENCVADCTVDLPPVDRNHLERVAVQMHGMRHHRAIDEIDLDALPRT
jgi:hypothetical protein